MNRAKFVAIDGPKGVGKTTALARCAATTEAVVVVKSPSDRFSRALEESLSGSDLLIAIVGDRRRQFDDEILPRLAAGQTVLLDRYVLSALAFHTLDGCSVDEVLAAHDGLPIPDSQVLLTASEATLLARRSARGTTTRLQNLPVRDELRAYAAGSLIMSALGAEPQTIHTDNLSVDQVAAAVVERVWD